MVDRGTHDAIRPSPAAGKRVALVSCGLWLAAAPALAFAQSTDLTLVHNSWMQHWQWALFAMLTALVGYVFFLNRRLRCQTRQAIAAEQVFRELAGASADWVWQTDAAGRYAEISQGFARISGQATQSVLGSDWLDCPQIAFTDADRRKLLAAIKQRKPIRDLVATVESPSDGDRHLRISGWPVLAADGGFAGYRGVAVDTSALVAARDQVRYLNDHDKLTGLPNRSVLSHRLNAILRLPDRDAASVALIAVDIERFGTINEGYGSSAGDDLIRQFAGRLRQAFGENDMIARNSNNEFIILRERVSALDPLPATIARFRKMLANPFEVGDERIAMTARIGIYEPAGGELQAETCIKRVQIALAHSKRQNQYVTIYAPGMDERAETIRRLEDDLRTAIDEDRLSMVYQPQMCLKSGRIVGAEALMRWLHPSLGEVSPVTFIPVAERAGMITDLSLWALRKAGAELERTKRMAISVNISALDFKKSDLVVAMEHIVDELQLDASRIELEVTESVLISDSQSALAILNRLKSAGFKIALDDFGTGYAGLGYLQMFPFDKLKIDQSFIRRLDESPHAQAIVRSVITLAHDLGLSVVAEGVERQAQVERLRQAGCDIVQGYFLGRPVTGDRLGKLDGIDLGLSAATASDKGAVHDMTGDTA